jgi:PAS domain S-box-containing protein
MTQREQTRNADPVTKVLVIESDDVIAVQITSALDDSDNDFEVTPCRSGADAAAVMQNTAANFDVLLTAVRLTDETGTQVSASLRDRFAVPVVYLMFDAGQEQDAADALATGAECVMVRDAANGWLKMLPNLLVCAVRRARQTAMNTPERLSVIVEADPASTEYKQAEETLLDLMPYLRAIVSNPFEYFLLLDQDATIRYINRMAEGVRFEDVIGKATLYDFIAEELYDMLRENLSAVFSTGKSVYFDTYAPALDRWYSNTVGPVYKDGAVIAASVFAREITEQKESEQKLVESERRFRLLAETIQDVFYIVDTTDFSTIYVSPAFETIYGLPIQTIYDDSRAFLAAVHPDDRERVHERQARWQREVPDTYVGSEYRVVRPDGSVRWVQHRSFVVRDNNGQEDRLIGVVSDITARIEAEQRLVETSSRLEAFFRTFPDLLFIVGEDGTMLDFRAGKDEDLYVGPNQFLGKKMPELLPPEVGGAVAAALAALRSTQEPQAIEYWLDVPSGHKAFEARLIGMSQDRVAVIARDITEQKTAEQNVRKAHAELEKRVLERTEALHKINEELRQEMVARRKTEEAFRRAEKLAAIGTLAAGIAHEINNPLGSILMAADNALYAVEHPEELAEAVDALSDIKSEAKRAGRIVKTVLQFARKDESQRQLYNLAKVVDRACRIYRDPAGERGVKIHLHVEGDLPEVRLNPSELEQVFINLISNAVEASQSGQSVDVLLGTKTGRIEITVTDAGCGMTREQLNRIFDPFFTTRQTEGGTGLGLSLSHTIVRHHGGTIEVESEPGSGTCFTVSLPIHVESEDNGKTEQSPDSG